MNLVLVEVVKNIKTAVEKNKIIHNIKTPRHLDEEFLIVKLFDNI